MKKERSEYKKQIQPLRGYFHMVIWIFCILVFVTPISMMLLILWSGYSIEGYSIRFLSVINFVIAGISSLLIGSVLLIFPVKKLVVLIKTFIDGFYKVSKGDFSVRIDTPNLAELGDSFNVMAEELSSVELFRSDFINQFSHEFKTPINSIHGFASLLKDPNLSEEERNEYITIIIEESKRLASLSSNILNLSKVENQVLLSEKADINISEQIRQVIILLEEQWSNKELEFTLELEEVTCSVNGDLMKQVWVNLIGNAIKFSDLHGEIIITLQKHEEAICFTIENTGVMINHPDKIYDRFYQDDDSHSTKGNGLGLTIVKKIVLLHAGTISLNQQGENRETTQFEVLIPI
ncbi:MAG: HAMP domain-containing sensor histidine kinase [Eubacteriales bacterium]